MFCEKIQLFSSIIFLCKWFSFVVVAVLCLASVTTKLDRHIPIHAESIGVNVWLA